MVCIRNNLKVHTQELEFDSNTRHVSRSKFKTLKKKSEVEDVEFDINLRKEELLNRDNCTWLSTSGASSPSSCSNDNSLSCYMDLKIDAWFISLLSTQSTASNSLFKTKVTFFDGSRVNPIEEASLVLDQIKNLDEGIVFNENLEEEEVVLWLGSECYSQTLDKRSKSKSKSTDFSNGSDEQSLFSSFSSSDYSSEVMDLEDFNADKPLFWPFNSTYESCPETKWDYFIMSPRKDISQVDNREPDTKKGCNRRLVFGTRLNMSPNMRKGSDIVAKEQVDVDRLTKRSVSQHKISLEDLLLVDRLITEGVIEQILGLGEFDGHEGIETELIKDKIST